MKNRPSLVHACIVGSAFAVLPALFISACSPEEKVNPVPISSSSSASSSSSSSSSGLAGQGGEGGGGGMAGSGGKGGSGGGTGGAMSSSGAMGGAGGQASSSSSGGTTGGAGGMGSGGAAMGGSGGMPPISDAGPSDSGLCPITTMVVTPDPGIHVATCSPISYSTNPPCSGQHYPIWAAFKWYDTPVPRGFFMHSMEHGAVVISYNCPAGCSDELGQLAAFLDARPADPTCTAPVKSRIIVTPDPLIDTKFAAAAWGAYYKGDCLDFSILGKFIDDHYAKSPENLCYDGTDVTSPDAGIPSGCGTASDAGTD